MTSFDCSDPDRRINGLSCRSNRSFGAVEPASSDGPRPPTLWDVFILYLPSILLYTVFAVAGTAGTSCGKATTVWSALRWDLRKTRFLFRSILSG